MLKGMARRLTSRFEKLEQWTSETLAGAIEADLRDAGYEVLGRADNGAVIWVDPAGEPNGQALTSRQTSA